MYITKDKIELIEKAEQLIQEVIKDTKEKFELGSFLQTIYLDNALNKLETDDSYLIKLYEDTNKKIYNFVDYVSSNKQSKLFKASTLKNITGIPTKTVQLLIDTIMKIIELNIYKTLGVRANEL